VANEPAVSSNNKAKAWQLLLLAVPALLGYLKSRAEATDQSKANFQTSREALLHLQEDAKANREEILLLKGRMLACENSRGDRDGIGEVSSDDIYIVKPTPVVPFFVDAGVSVSLLMLDVLDSGATDSGWVQELPKALPEPTPAPTLVLQTPPHQALDLPANLDEAVERYKSKK
jgi:hypothetical protein